MLHMEQPRMCDQGTHEGWMCLTNVQVIKHAQLTYKQVKTMYDLFAQPIEQAHK